MNILKLLSNTTQEMRAKDIEQYLWNLEPGKSSEIKVAFHVKIFRELHRLQKENLLQKRKVSYKDVRYSIKDKGFVQLVLAADAIGLDSFKKESLKMSTVLSGKNYEAAIQGLAKFLLAIVFQRKDFAQRAHVASPGPIIFGFPVPIFQEKDNILRDKVLIIAPDERSANKIRTFTKEQYEDFLQYLTSAWTMYFEESKIAHGDVVIIHFIRQQAERLKQMVELGEGQNIDEIVHLATLRYLDIHGPNREYFRITADGPATRLAIEKGIYKDKRQAIEDAINIHEKRLAKRLLETIE